MILSKARHNLAPFLLAATFEYELISLHENRKHLTKKQCYVCITNIKESKYEHQSFHHSKKKISENMYNTKRGMICIKQDTGL